jgi:hypothetical protein
MRGIPQRRSRYVVFFLLFVTAIAGNVTRAAEPITQEEAHSIGVAAYLYLYPLVTMEVTRRQLVNTSKPSGLHAPMNMFVNVAAFPSADERAVVRPNFDTLYSSAWLDLSKEPMVVSAPDTHGRYYLLPMMDMWSDVFASPGSRTTGTQAGAFAVVPPGWSGTLPPGVVRIDSPTPYVWIIGRTKTDGPADYAAVHEVQAGYTITPLSGWGKPRSPVVGTVDPTLDMKTAPKTIVDTMSASQYFAYAADILKSQPPHVTDQPILAQMKKIGIEPGKSFDIEQVDPAIKAGLDTVPQDALRLMAWKIPSLARIANGWSMNTDTMGVYGNYYLKRAIVAQVGLGANLPEDAIYPLNLADEAGKPLDGSNDYVLHFDQSSTPPVDAFWSLTLYDDEGFQVANKINRFALGSYSPFQRNPDGSVDLYVQNASPGPGKEENWLPAPKGSFSLTMRLYAPKSAALNGEWSPPVVRQRVAVTPLITQ